MHLAVLAPRILVYLPWECRWPPVAAWRLSMKRMRHTPELIVTKLREAEAMLAASRGCPGSPAHGRQRDDLSPLGVQP